MPLNKKNIALWVLVLVVAVMFAVWGILPSFKNTLAPAAGYHPPAVLDITHKVAGEQHTYSGELMLTSCQELSTSFKLLGTVPPQLRLAIVVRQNPGCADEVPEPKVFSFGATAQGDTVPELTAVTLNGSPQEFTVVESH